MSETTDTVINTVVPLIGLSIVAGMAGRMMDRDHPHYRARKKKIYHKKHTHMY